MVSSRNAALAGMVGPVVFALTLIFFALGLHREVASRGRLSWAGPALLAVSGVALVRAAFKTDPHLMDGPQTWHGAIHFLAFILLVLSFLLSLFFWWRLGETHSGAATLRTP